MEKLLYTISETGRLLSVSRPTIYKIISTGDLKTITIGTRRLVTVDAELKRINTKK